MVNNTDRKKWQKTLAKGIKAVKKHMCINQKRCLVEHVVFAAWYKLHFTIDLFCPHIDRSCSPIFQCEIIGLCHSHISINWFLWVVYVTSSETGNRWWRLITFPILDPFTGKAKGARGGVGGSSTPPLFGKRSCHFLPKKIKTSGHKC